MKVGPTYAWDWAMQPEGIPQNATGQIFELYAKDQIGKEQFVQMMAAAVADYVAQ
jgi:raffinose/stachyose/melibiose transport system substrate-binding protein